MELRALLAQLPRYSLLRGDPSLDVKAIAYDSREVRPGDLFVCWQGLRFDGHAFAREAVARGAVAVVAERPIEGLAERAPADVLDGNGTGAEGGSVAQVLVPDGREALARLSAAFYGFPSRRLRLIGVTGTNGKTTTTHLIKAVLEEAGHKVGLIGTIRHLIGDEVLESHRTTPESLDLQRMLFHMAERGMEYAVMEVSSHALALQRTVGTEFDVAVFTNVTRDHLDFHESFHDYVATKAQLFASLDPRGTKPNKGAIINMDDPHAGAIADRCRVPVIGYGIDGRTDVYASDPLVRPAGVAYHAHTPSGSLPLHLQLTGRFNVYNSLAAVAVGWHEGVPLAIMRAALEKVPGVPGRLERVDGGQDFTVLVDYAHTPDSLENVLRTCRGFAAGRILVVFGCGGDRDVGKRPLMGDIAARFADVVIITSDNPRSEDPEAICRDVEEGVLAAGGAPGGHHVIVERREAIRTAIRLAQPGDIVLIAGKGHETSQVFRDRTVRFNDREEAAFALKERFGDGTAVG